GTVADFDAHLYLGTSSWLVCHVPFRKTDLLHNLASIPSAIPGRYLLANEQESAGVCLAELVRVLSPAGEGGGSDDRYAEVLARAARGPARPGRLLQPVARRHPRPPGPGGPRGRGLQLALAADLRGAVRGAAP